MGWRTSELHRYGICRTDEINQTIGIVVQFISAVLAAWTGKKITDAKNASKAKAEQSADSTEEVKG